MRARVCTLQPRLETLSCSSFIRCRLFALHQTDPKTTSNHHTRSQLLQCRVFSSSPHAEDLQLLRKLERNIGSSYYASCPSGACTLQALHLLHNPAYPDSHQPLWARKVQSRRQVGKLPVETGADHRHTNANTRAHAHKQRQTCTRPSYASGQLAHRHSGVRVRHSELLPHIRLCFEQARLPKTQHNF